MGVHHLTAPVAQGLALLTQRRHTLVQAEQVTILLFRSPREGFTAERIVITVQPHFIAIVDAGYARPGKEPGHRQRQTRHILTQQRFKACGIVAVELVKHPQLLLMRQASAIVLHPRHAGFGVNMLRIVRDIGVSEEPPQREGEAAIVHRRVFCISLQPLTRVAKVLPEDERFRPGRFCRPGNGGDMLKVIPRPA